MNLNEMKEVRSERLRDSYYEGKHPSGLQIYLYPKKENASTYAIFGTRYGSVDTRFRRSDEKRRAKSQRELRIIWSISFSRAKTEMLLPVMQKQELRPMPILLLM